MVPSNIEGPSALTWGSARLVVSTDSHPYWVVDTDSGAITAYETPTSTADGQQVRPAATGVSNGIAFTPLSQTGSSVELGVFTVASLEMQERTQIVGIGARALVLLASEHLAIHGMITVGADRRAAGRHPGPGGFAGATAIKLPGEGTGAGRAGPSGRAGGGGGSLGGAGGAGARGGSGGRVHSNVQLVPLFGGSGGGAGWDSGLGGHGGGALQLGARRHIEVGLTGQVGACGGGGQNGRRGGGGGGAGGALLIEAPEVFVRGFIGANGGAGGGVAATGQGMRGELDRAPAREPSGIGGSGSDPGGKASEGRYATYGGGGGGGAGRIRINTASGQLSAMDGGLLPSVASGLTTLGRLHALSAAEPCRQGVTRCVAAGLERCDNGQRSVDSCELGCGGTPARCLSIKASNIASRLQWQGSKGALDVGAVGANHWLVNTDNGAIDSYPTKAYRSQDAVQIRAAGLGQLGGVTFERLAQANSPQGLGVFTLARLTVPVGASFVARGTRALVILAADRIDVHGELSVGADRVPGAGHPGAGGYRAGRASQDNGEGPGGGGGGRGGGGGGGGHGARGGSSGGKAGNTYGSAVLVPLLGGSGGGSGNGNCVAAGGDGGGALQLTATQTIRIGATAVIDARGAGGRGGPARVLPTLNTDCGGGGGGAGGAILLEAPVVQIDGVLSANGGAGGRGHDASIGDVVDGAAGATKTAPVAGPPAGSQGGAGGDGSAPNGVPGAGASLTTQGGAGGAGGRIRVNTATGAETFPSATVLPNWASGLASIGRIHIGR